MMSNNQPQQTLADFVAILISPVLIMALVGSLVFFIVEVLLGPESPERLLWTLFFFVFAAVLIARISMSGDIAERAPIYGLVLGGLVWIALSIYVKYPSESRLADFGWLVNAGLIAIIWWSAHRLTWDSTLIDDKQDASGAGLLQVAGLDKQTDSGEVPKEAAPDKQSKKQKRQRAGLDGWIERYRKYRQERGQRPHAPGVWVVYFSLAALPLFGLGQSLIPPLEVERRQHAFWLMAIYVGSGLGLLLTTSFLNLRRYLRQRNLQMPLAMTGVWLTGGALIIAMLLVVGAVIPRPNAEYRLIDLAGIVGIKDREKSQEGGGDTKDNNEGGKTDLPQKDAAGKNSEPKSKSKVGDKTADDQERKDGQKDSDPKVGDRKGENQPTGPRPESPSAAPNLLGELPHQLYELLKWILGGVAALVITFLVLRALLRFLANFTHWAGNLLRSAQSWWDRLLGLWQRPLPEAILDEPAALTPPRPFVAFRDPFTSGDAGRKSPAELVRFAFDALEAWAYERGLQRQAVETPLEFVERLTLDYPALEKVGQDLANLYVGLAYARRPPSPQRVETLRVLWPLLDELVERPMSAGV